MLGLMSTLFPLIEKIVARIPDPALREKASLEMQAQLLQASIEESKGQLAVNAAEATNSSVFVSGWRPFIGWMGGASLLYKFLLHPILSWVLLLIGITTPLPAPDTEALMALVTAMLGVTAARSFDKWKGTSK